MRNRVLRIVFGLMTIVYLIGTGLSFIYRIEPTITVMFAITTVAFLMLTIVALNQKQKI